ncbi:uncharacterized protein AMSG_10877 [Thecamonas trahens ATCC 50062]|uniref:CUB domain-containing protein n=1 Tax=Thecamonas trahens ATCC 50062 TaxID=461836 RepID=A0A0L0DUR5_THETB|nr:hypothetical protein AMSG_10877 [Thecamonas trahens ATCC 50062]KNC55243.1 hypothetical protein AMSG_10877 [Thecamonas trahens ATCC 50062]|eukprot:XP_013753172.1 hypothetical protein AMSG_10877 [Thecamonas trahens ATCC 50062]
MISDGSGDYGNMMTCVWHITSPGALVGEDGSPPELFLTLYFHMIALECGWDFVYVYEIGNGLDDAPLVGMYSGMYTPDALVSTSGALAVVFVSDEAMADRGFQLSFTFSPCPFNCFYAGQCIMSSRTCLCQPGRVGTYCEMADPGMTLDPEYGPFQAGSTPCDQYSCDAPESIVVNASNVFDLFRPATVQTFSRILPQPCMVFPGLTNASRVGSCWDEPEAVDEPDVAAGAVVPLLPGTLPSVARSGVSYRQPTYGRGNTTWFMLPPAMVAVITLFFAVLIALFLVCMCLVTVQLVTSQATMRRFALMRVIARQRAARRFSPEDIEWFVVHLDAASGAVLNPVLAPAAKTLAAPHPGAAPAADADAAPNSDAASASDEVVPLLSAPAAPPITRARPRVSSTIPAFEYKANGDVARSLEFVVLAMPARPSPATDADGFVAHAALARFKLGLAVVSLLPLSSQASSSASSDDAAGLIDASRWSDNSSDLDDAATPAEATTLGEALADVPDTARLL